MGAQVLLASARTEHKFWSSFWKLKMFVAVFMFSQQSLIGVLGRTVGKHTNTLTAVIIHGAPTDSTYYWTLTLNRTWPPVYRRDSLWNTSTEWTSVTVRLQWSPHKPWRTLVGGVGGEKQPSWLHKRDRYRHCGPELRPWSRIPVCGQRSEKHSQPSDLSSELHVQVR